MHLVLAFRRLRQELKVSLGYVESSKSTWAIVLKKKKGKRKEKNPRMRAVTTGLHRQ